MNFEEWLAINPLSEFLSNVQVSNMKTAWNASRNNTIDEAVKVVIEEDSDDYIAGPVTKFLIKEIKELKE